jgi:hypothetical protein
MNKNFLRLTFALFTLLLFCLPAVAQQNGEDFARFNDGIVTMGQDTNVQLRIVK